MSEVSPFPGGASWNVDTLKAYVDSLLIDRDRAVDAALAGQEKAVDAAFASQEKAVASALAAQDKYVSAALAAQKEAVDKAESAADKRFSSVNGFQVQLNEQGKTFATRSDLENLKEQLSEVKLALSRSDSKDVGFSSAADRIVQIIPIFISLVAIVIALWSLR